MSLSRRGDPCRPRLGLVRVSIANWLLGVLCLASACSGSRVAVQRAQVAQSWQSSVYAGSEDHCFLVKPTAQGNWAYFHSGDVPDASGYQWLLVKLAQPVRLVSVAIFARPGEVSRRVLGTEVLLSESDTLPADQLQPRADSRCLASLRSHAAVDAAFSRCGRVGSDTSKLEFACSQTDCAKTARLILIRRLVRNEADKFFNFIGLELEEALPAEFLTCAQVSGRPGDCLRYGLQQQRAGRSIELVKACLPCRLVATGEGPSCRLNRPGRDAADLRVFPVRQPPTEFLFYLSECPLCGLQCSYRCEDQPDTLRTVTDTIRFQVPPRAVKLHFGESSWVGHYQQPRFWPAESFLTFVFFTESALPKPEHSCVLMAGLSGRQCPSSGTVLLPEIESVQPEAAVNGSLTFSLSSRYRLFTNASIDGCKVFCVSRLQGTKFAQNVSGDVPQLVYKCQTRLILPSRDLWVEGAELQLTVDSSANNQVSTSHSCSIQTGQGAISLSAFETGAMSSTYRLTASRHWGRGVSIRCLVNQSGLLETTSEELLPDVMYKTEVRISSCFVDQASIQISVVTSGGAPAPSSVLCSIGKDSKSIRANASSTKLVSLGSLTWSFQPIPVQLRPAGSSVFCTVTQADAAGQVKFQSVHNATFETASACEGGINILKVGLIVIAVVAVGPFLVVWARSLLRFSRKFLGHRRGSWSPSQIPMTTYDHNSFDMDGFSEWGRFGAERDANFCGTGSNFAASTCNTLIGRTNRRQPSGEVHAIEERGLDADCPGVVYDRVLSVSPCREPLTDSAASLATEYNEIVGTVGCLAPRDGKSQA